ncbi:MAG: sensor histidine kinase, partial [Streptococcus parasanguinis]|nr:sensor histidine kinase [Streptococcus parasanguinis]
MKRYPLLIQLVLYFFLFILLLFGLIGGLYYQTSSGTIRQLTERTTRNSIDQSSQFITSYLKKLKQTTTVLSKEQAVRQFAQDRSADQETVQHLMRTMIETDPDLVSAVLVTKDGRLVATDSKISMQTSSDMMNESWYQEAIKERAMPVLTPARKESLTSEKEKWVVSITQEVVDQAGQNLGVVRLDIGYDSLQAYLDHLQLGKQGFSFIINQKHEFVYHPKKAVYSSSQEMQAMQPYIAVKDGYAKGGQNFIYQVPIPDSDWTLIGVASLEGLQMLQSQLLYSFIGLGLLALIMCLIGIGFVLRLWIKPLRDLQTIILRIGAGDAHLRAAAKGSPELMDLAQAFNAMLDQIDHLMQQVKEEEQNARRYELRALSAQINPHFLYNTLDTIIWMAEFQDSQRVVQVTKSLATYFRLAPNQGKDLICLSDEINHVRQYLFIQKQRYGDKLEYEIEENPAFDKLVLPKLVLQPLVENALYHGIKEKEGQGHIEVSVQKQDSGLIIRIEDD